MNDNNSRFEIWMIKMWDNLKDFQTGISKNDTALLIHQFHSFISIDLSGIGMYSQNENWS